MTKHKNEDRKTTHKIEESHPVWELEVQTEGLDALQGERLEKETRKPSKKAKA